MQISQVRTTLLTGPCTEDPFLSRSRAVRSAAFIEVVTDGQLVGLGETYAGYFIPEAVPSIVEFFAPILIGQTAEEVNIPELWRRMYRCGNFWCRTGLGLAVINGIEAALWDLRGKLLGEPVWRLLSGGQTHHPRLPCYATGGPSNYPKDQLAAKMDYYLAEGFRGFKLGAGAHDLERGWHSPSDPSAIVAFEADKLAFVRAHVGQDVRVMLDAHMGNSPAGIGTWTLHTALAVAHALAPFGLYFLEEPLPYTDPQAYQALRAAGQVPIAGGECLTGVMEWQPFIAADAFDIAQPDASFTGGLIECLRVAEMTGVRGRRIATHAWGAGGSLMQNVHLGFAAANTAILEMPAAPGPLHREIMHDSLVRRDGDVLPPETPGLGIVLHEQTRRRFPFIAGSGEFISVSGKILQEERNRCFDN